jgi:putative DNA primase/helicase
VPFGVTIPPKEQDKTLAARLRAEWPAILRWLAAGCVEWQRVGLGEPAEVLVATGGYRTDSDMLGQFLEEGCLIGDGLVCPAGVLYLRYRCWSEDHGDRPRNQKWLGQQLVERGFSRTKNTAGLIVYAGLSVTAKADGPLGFLAGRSRQGRPGRRDGGTGGCFHIISS